MTSSQPPEEYEGACFSPDDALFLLDRLLNADATLRGANGFVETSEGLEEPIDLILDLGLGDTQLDTRSRVEVVRKFIVDHSTRAAAFELVWDYDAN